MHGPRRPDMYEVLLELIMRNENDYQQETRFTRYPMARFTNHETIVELTLGDSTIQPNNIYLMNVSASNSAGSSIIVQDLIISKSKT